MLSLALAADSDYTGSMRRLALVLFAASAAVLGVGLVAEAQQYPPDFTITVDDSTPEPGGPVVATVTGCTDGETVNFVLEASKAQGTCTAGGGGTAMAMAFIGAPATTTASGNLTAPTAPGTYDVTGTGQTSELTATTQITVAAAAPATPTAPASGALPSTGSGSTNTTVLIAGGLFAMGAALFAVSRFRHRQPNAA